MSNFGTGDLSLTHEGGIMKDHTAVSAILEAVGTAHNGENKTEKPVRLLMANMGAEDVANPSRCRTTAQNFSAVSCSNDCVQCAASRSPRNSRRHRCRSGTDERSP